MEDKTKIRLTAAEISGVWSQYINDTLSVCVNTYFLKNIEDEEVRPVVEFALKTAKENITIMKEIFLKEQFPIPVGFTKEDFNPNAPKLFSDTFILMYLRQMSILAMAANSAALGLVTRPDIVSFHKRVLQRAVQLQDLTRELMLKQGTYIKPPYITTCDEAEFVQTEKFLGGFFGSKRALTSIEITHLFLNSRTNSIGKALITAFAQVAQKKDVKQFLIKGKEIAQKHMNTFEHYLEKEDLPAPMGWDSSISDCTSFVFSDKLIMFHISAMITAGIGNYGMAMAASPRKDIALKYASLIPEIAAYAGDGAKIMIKHGWMEEPPQTDDRNQLIKK
ncbi:DUF3231 family protein [Metabacillus fastidiosus]|uniref:DUF3231 family protein n=1 Tax=Metabacillus fastidiosus TaxID=1458 RepID=UPI00082681B2|nr:DUF3231 family protein [Metabacillus fastidiosus]MED4463484.1 DUF3231 family protein [Metabacillus fastidiosus]